LRTFECEKTLEGHMEPVNPLLELPKLVLLSGSRDATIRFWKLAKNQDNQCYRKIENSNQSRCEVLLLLTSTHMACGSFKDINIYDLGDTTQPIKILRGHGWTVTELITMSDGVGLLSASASYDENVKVWNWQAGTCVRSFEGPGRLIHKMLVFNRSVLVTACGDGSIKFWEIKSGKCLKEIFEHQGSVNYVVTKSDGTMVSCGEDRSIFSWGMVPKKPRVSQIDMSRSQSQTLMRPQSGTKVKVAHASSYLA